MDNNNRSYKNLMNFSSLSAHRNAVYGFAALWIVFFHGVDMSKAAFPSKLSFLWDSFQLGNTGVDMFLFLSGIGLYFSFSKDSRVIRFYAKRFIRILVPFILLCVPYMTYLLIVGRYSVWVYLKSITAISYWTNDASRLSLWYISVILVLYLFYPLIHRFIYKSDKGFAARCTLLAAVSIVITLVLWWIDPNGFYKSFDKFLPRIAVFIVGCGFGRLVKEKKRIPEWFLVAALVVVFFAYPLYAKSALTGPFKRYYGSLFAVMTVFLLSQLFEILSGTQLYSVLTLFGGFSLEIYLASIEARNWYMHSDYYGSHLLLDYTALMIGAIVIAYLISLLEKPIIRFLNRHCKLLQ